MATLLRCFRNAKKREQFSVSKDANGAAQQQTTASETWTVVYDGSVDKADVVTASLGTPDSTLPTIGNTYSGLLCTRVNPIRSAESPYVWDVTVDFSNLQQPAGGGGSGTNWNITLTRSSVAREETATQDRLHLPLVNTLGELLPQLPNQTLYDELLSISYSTRTPPVWMNGHFEGQTNSDTITFTICGITRSFDKGQCKCVGMSLKCTRSQIGGGPANPVYQYTYDCELSFQIRKPKWVWNAPNEGFRGYVYNDAGTDYIDTLRDPQSPMGTPRTAATKLGLDGYPLPPGAKPLKLPDDAIDATIPNGCRTYVADGAFELELQGPMSALFAGLNDPA